MVGAFWADHTEHDASLKVFVAAHRKSAACGIDSLAEVYATMTALPVRPVLAPEQVWLFVQQIAERLTLVSLLEDEYLRTLSEAAERRLSSGRVYDALLVACARKSQAEIIYTWDVKHFRQIATDLADRIRTP